MVLALVAPPLASPLASPLPALASPVPSPLASPLASPPMASPPSGMPLRSMPYGDDCADGDVSPRCSATLPSPSPSPDAALGIPMVSPSPLASPQPFASSPPPTPPSGGEFEGPSPPPTGQPSSASAFASPPSPKLKRATMRVRPPGVSNTTSKQAAEAAAEAAADAVVDGRSAAEQVNAGKEAAEAVQKALDEGMDKAAAINKGRKAGTAKLNSPPPRPSPPPSPPPMPSPPSPPPPSPPGQGGVAGDGTMTVRAPGVASNTMSKEAKKAAAEAAAAAVAAGKNAADQVTAGKEAAEATQDAIDAGMDAEDAIAAGLDAARKATTSPPPSPSPPPSAPPPSPPVRNYAKPRVIIATSGDLAETSHLKIAAYAVADHVASKHTVMAVADIAVAISAGSLVWNIEHPCMAVDSTAFAEYKAWEEDELVEVHTVQAMLDGLGLHQHEVQSVDIDEDLTADPTCADLVSPPPTLPPLAAQAPLEPSPAATSEADGERDADDVWASVFGPSDSANLRSPPPRPPDVLGELVEKLEHLNASLALGGQAADLAGLSALVRDSLSELEPCAAPSAPPSSPSEPCAAPSAPPSPPSPPLGVASPSLDEQLDRIEALLNVTADSLAAPDEQIEDMRRTLQQLRHAGCGVEAAAPPPPPVAMWPFPSWSKTAVSLPAAPILSAGSSAKDVVQQLQAVSAPAKAAARWPHPQWVSPAKAAQRQSAASSLAKTRRV